MGDQGMDPCECIWSHEMAMRRLLNLLRNSQSYCTETACYDDGNPPNPTNQNDVLLLSLLFVAAIFLYFFRPRPQRIIDAPSKPSNGNDSSDPPSPSVN